MVWVRILMALAPGFVLLVLSLVTLILCAIGKEAKTFIEWVVDGGIDLLDRFVAWDWDGP